MTTYYLFKPMSPFGTGYYEGKKVEADAPPILPHSQWEPPAVDKGYLAYFDGYGWVIAPSVLDAKDATFQAMYAAYSASKASADVSALDSGYAPYEINTWTRQLQDAKSYLYDTTAVSLRPVPIFLANLAKARGEDVKTLAEKIVAKDAKRSAALAEVMGGVYKANSADAATCRAWFWDNLQAALQYVPR